MKTKTTCLLVFVSFLLLFSAIFYDYLSVKLWDYDFWWHISTGRYIVETGSIPDKDPFSYTSELEENKNLFPERESFLLKQYWLSQVVFYQIYNTFGAKGIIILRSLILFLIVFSVFWGLKGNGVNFYVSFIFIFLTYISTMTYTGERPVLFTMLFSVLVFLILDRFTSNRGKAIFLLIPLMLVWANMHGGFIIGIIFIMVYMLSEGSKIISKNAEYTRREVTVFYAAATLALLSSYINPTGWYAFSIALSPGYKPFYAGIQEYASPFILYKEKLSPINYAYVALVSIFPLILIVRNKKIDLAHIMLLSGLLFMSISALRYEMFYVTIGAIVLGKEINLMIEKQLERGFLSTKKRWLTSVFAVMILFSSLAYFIGIVDFSGLKFEQAASRSVPKLAVDFMEENRLSGNIYNDFGFGGYITWRLYPWKKTFADTRWLNSTVSTEAKWILEAKKSIRSEKLQEGKIPLWERLLDHYNVDSILLDTLDVVGTVPPLLLRLLENDKWIPVHVDLISVIFVRDKESNKEIIKRFGVPEEIVYNAVISRVTQWALFNKENPRYLSSLGDIFYSMGRMDDALSAYEYADKRLPGGNLIKHKIELIKKEIGSK